jgi:hypothetical protein
MDNNPFVTVPSPNYAAPIVNLFGNQNQKPQQQNQQNPQQQNPQQPNWGQQLRAWLQQRQQQQQPGQMGPQANAQPGAPVDLTPGSVAGANQMFAGLY